MNAPRDAGLPAATAAPALATIPADRLRVDSEIEIARPIQIVFDYVSTPALWHTWHPATVQVRDAPLRPLVTGETMRESIAMAGRRAEALWTVRACLAPLRWEISTETDQGYAYIVYALYPTAAGCRFHRTLEFRSKRWPWRMFDATLMRWLLERQSTKALQNLKRVLEAITSQHIAQGGL